jgi:uncharacterized protein (DUF362 family)
MRRWKDLSRRDFLGFAGATGGAALASGLSALPPAAVLPAAAIRPAGFQPWSERGRIVQVVDERALTRLAGLPAVEPVRAMVARAVCALTGKRTPEEAWAALIHPGDTVGLKPNMLGGRFMATQKEVLDAVVDGLLSIGVSPDRIVVWEQRDALLRRGRLTPSDAAGKVRYLGFMTRGLGGQLGPVSRHGAGTSRYCEVVHRVSAIINLPVFKDHGIAGITVSLKNLSHGAIDNPSDYHHSGSGEIAHIYAHPVLAPKVRLTLADALRVQYDGGPSDSSRKVLHHSLYASTDPVAIDSTALALIETLRRDKGLLSLSKDGRPARHVEEAHSLGLGAGEAGQIRLEKLRLG